MANDIKSIAEIFSGRIFRIPDYQRGYAWEDKHRQAFWDDLEIMSSTPNGPPHYTGLISLEPIKKPEAVKYLQPPEHWLLEGRELCLVVDGQQRLTTLVIFIHELLLRHAELSGDNDVLTTTTRRSGVEETYIRQPNLLAPGNFGYLFGYANNPDMDDFLRRSILDDSGIAAAGAVTSAYARELANAKNFFHRKFSSFDQQKLSEWYQLVANRIRFNLFEVSNDFDVCLTFEAMNNRGKPLSDLEKLKSRFLYLAGLLAGKNEAEENRKQALLTYRNHINSHWKVVYEMLGWCASNVLDDDQFLNLVWLLRFNKPGESRDQHLFSEEFHPSRIMQAGWSSIHAFVRDLGAIAPSWVLINTPEECDALLAAGKIVGNPGMEALSWVARINRLDSLAFLPLITAAMVHFQNDRITAESFVELCKAVERHIFIVFGLAERRSHTGRNLYFGKAAKLYEDASMLQQLVSEINVDTDSKFSIDAFFDSVKGRQQWGDKKGFYAWDELPVVLFEYESNLHNTRYAGNNPKVSWVEWKQGDLAETVEHIYPQTADNKYWTERFGALVDDRQRLLAHSLGNLLLLSRSKNSELQNYSYVVKAREGDHCYRRGSFSEMEVESDWNDWTPDAICSRTERLLEFIGQRWKVPLWNEASKKILEQIKTDNECPPPLPDQIPLQARG